MQRPGETGNPTPLTADAFTAAYDRHVDMVFRYLSRRLGPDVGEELTAQTFAEAWAGRATYDPDRGSVLPWLMGIATNLVRRHFRSETRQLRAYAATGQDPVSTFDEVAVLDRLEAADRARTVAEVLSELSAIDRDVLYLYSALGSYQQIADALDLPIGTVRSRLSRARRHLEARLDRKPSDLGSER